VLIITLGGCAFTYCLCVYNSSLSSQIYSPLIPTIATAIIASLIALLFMIVYGMSIDTILQCFLLEESLAKKHGQDVQHTPETLKDIMDDIDKK